MTPGTVFIRDGLPSLPTPCARSLVALARALPPEVTILHADSSYHDEQCNMAAEVFLGDWFVTLDCDQVFGASLVERLWTRAEELGVAALTGVYYRRLNPYWPLLAWRAADGGFEQYQRLPQTDEAFRVGACGLGCLFVRRSAFDAVRAAFPEERPFDFRNGLREDYALCDRLDRAGIELWCDPTIRVGHLAWCAMERQTMPEANRARYEAWPEQVA